MQRNVMYYIYIIYIYIRCSTKIAITIAGEKGENIMFFITA